MQPTTLIRRGRAKPDKHPAQIGKYPVGRICTAVDIDTEAALHRLNQQQHDRKHAKLRLFRYCIDYGTLSTCVGVSRLETYIRFSALRVRWPPKRFWCKLVINTIRHFGYCVGGRLETYIRFATLQVLVRQQTLAAL